LPRGDPADNGPGTQQCRSSGYGFHEYWHPDEIMIEQCSQLQPKVKSGQPYLFIAPVRMAFVPVFGREYFQGDPGGA